MPVSPLVYACFSSLSCSAACIVRRRRSSRANRQQPVAGYARRSKMRNAKSFQPVQTTHITAEQVGLRLDRYLVSLLDNVSRTGAQQLIAEGAILVNGRQGKASYALRQGDEIQVLQTVPAPSRRDMTPQFIPLDVIYE